MNREGHRNTTNESPLVGPKIPETGVAFRGEDANERSAPDTKLRSINTASDAHEQAIQNAKEGVIAKYPPDPIPNERNIPVATGPRNTFTYTHKEKDASKIKSFLKNAQRKLFMSLGLLTLGTSAIKAESGNSAEKTFSDPLEKKTEKKVGVGKDNRIERDSLIKEYGEVMAGRWDDFKILNKKTPEGKTYRQIFNELGEEYGIAPEILFASAAEEGLRNYLINPYDTQDKVYKVSGFENFGLDHFAEAFPILLKKKLLDADFSFKESIHTNEKGISVKSADFKTPEDAIRAKVALLRLNSDKIVEFADKNGIGLSDTALDFFMLIAYNAGFTNATKMLTDYHGIGALDDDAFLKARPTKGSGTILLKENSWEQPYTNVIRRIKPAEAWKNKGVMEESSTVKKLGQSQTNSPNTAKVTMASK